MICILRMNGQEIKGWLIAIDTDEARRAVENQGERELARALYLLPSAMASGRYEICPGFTMLVD